MNLPSQGNGKVAHVADHQGEPCDDVKEGAKCHWRPPFWEGKESELSTYHWDFKDVYLLLKQEQPQHASPLGIGCHLKGIMSALMH